MLRKQKLTCAVPTSDVQANKAKYLFTIFSLFILKCRHQGNLSVTNFAVSSRSRVLHFYNVNSWFERWMGFQRISMVLSGAFNRLADKTCALRKENVV